MPLNRELQPWLREESGDGTGRGRNSDFALMFWKVGDVRSGAGWGGARWDVSRQGPRSPAPSKGTVSWMKLRNLTAVLLLTQVGGTTSISPSTPASHYS